MTEQPAKKDELTSEWARQRYNDYLKSQPNASVPKPENPWNFGFGDSTEWARRGYDDYLKKIHQNAIGFIPKNSSES